MIGSSVLKSSSIFQRFYNLRSTIENFFESLSENYIIQIDVPKNIYLRAESICMYVQDKYSESEIEFTINNLITLLYVDFLENSVLKYEPKKIHEHINRSNRYEENHDLIINDMGKYFKFEEKKTVIYEVTFEMAKTDIERGQLLLDEMEELFGTSPSIEQMIATLLINFVEEYKAGKSKEAINRIFNLVKKYFHDNFEK